MPGQSAFAPGHRGLIRGQPPAGIEGLAEDAGLVAGENRLEAHLRRQGIDPDSALEQPPGADRLAQQGDAVVGVGLGEMAGAQAAGGLGVGLDDDRRAGVFLLGKDQHLLKLRPRRARGGDRGIAAGLVDHQHIAGRRCRGHGVETAVFRQMCGPDPGNGVAGAGHQRGIVERRLGQQPFEIADPGGVEMHSGMVDHQPQRRLAAGTAGVERAQKGILDADKAGAATGGNGFAAMGRRALAPDRHQVVGAGQADADVVAGQREDAAQSGLGQETAVVDIKTPGPCGPGAVVVIGCAHLVSRRSDRRRPMRSPRSPSRTAW